MDLQQTADLANKISEVQWVKWVHQSTKPANSNDEKRANVLKSAILRTHCARCLNMNGCCFAEDKCPQAPLHEKCHCEAERIYNITVVAECPIEKFTGYVFDKVQNKGKKELFESWGFTIADSVALKSEFEKQAYQAYLSGKYELNTLDSFGQRINIYVTLTTNTGKQVSFKTGWMSYPDGKILLTTPFGGFIE